MVKELSDTPSVSIVIRTKNEEQWIGHCLDSIFSQSYRVSEVVIVDNGSSDNTLKICSRYKDVKVIKIKKYLPGLSLNRGIAETKSELVGIISSHCIPKDNKWLSFMVSGFKNAKVSGVYGRQIPTSYSSHNDVRDLFITFGEESRIQKNDSFFHNANSMIRRKTWVKVKFDEEATNIEDRIWAQKILRLGKFIKYESKAIVYHHHGIHHARDFNRARSTLNIIKKISDKNLNYDLPYSMMPGNSNVQAIIPVPASIRNIGNFNPVEELHKKILESNFISDYLFLYKEKSMVKNLPKNKTLQSNQIGNKKFTLLDIMNKAVRKLNNNNNYPDYILYINPEYVFKPKGFFDDLIKAGLFGGYSSTTIAYKDYSDYWFQNSDSEIYESLNDKILAKEEKAPLFRALFGQGTLIRPALLREGSLSDAKNQGIIETNDINLTLRIDNKNTFKLIKKLL